ncbi:MAG: 3-phosphoglycerate dehydrogenase [Bacteroidota bacterium]
MHLLIADKFSDAAQDELRAAGHTVAYDPTLKGDALIEALRAEQPQVLLVRSTKVTAEALDASNALELIVRAGAGVDTIDVAGAAERGLFVANCPGKNAAAVAELAFGLIVALDRRIPDNVIAARAGRWDKAGFSKARGLKGRTLGLVGMGHIGRAMVERARGFGMPVVAWSRSLTPEQATALGIGYAESPMKVAARADIVSLHVAATPETHHLANGAFFEAMQPGAFFLNTARESVVDEEALAWAVREKGIRAATDVPAGEPAAKQTDWTHPLADDLYLTHHIGASTAQATEAIGQEAARVILTYAETGQVPNVVNLAVATPATHLLTVRHRDQVGVLAGVLDHVRQADWNVQEMENLIFEGHAAACARIRFQGDPSDEALARIQGSEGVLAATVIAL